MSTPIVLDITYPRNPDALTSIDLSRLAAALVPSVTPGDVLTV